MLKNQTYDVIGDQTRGWVGVCGGMSALGEMKHQTPDRGEARALGNGPIRAYLTYKSYGPSSPF